MADQLKKPAREKSYSYIKLHNLLPCMHAGYNDNDYIYIAIIKNILLHDCISCIGNYIYM